jgi:hypothetical protein
MKSTEGAKIIEQVARNNGISVEEVRKEIDLAIAVGMSSSEPAAREFWEPYIKSGWTPTPEEFVIIMAKRVESRN